jgi:hypothetical protein
MRSRRPIRAAAALAATAMLTSAFAVPVANAAGAEEARPDRFSFKRASYLVPGGSAGWGISEPMTSYLKIVDGSSGSGVLAARCRR